MPIFLCHIVVFVFYYYDFLHNRLIPYSVPSGVPYVCIYSCTNTHKENRVWMWNVKIKDKTESVIVINLSRFSHGFRTFFSLDFYSLFPLNKYLQQHKKTKYIKKWNKRFFFPAAVAAAKMKINCHLKLISYLSSFSPGVDVCFKDAAQMNGCLAEEFMLTLRRFYIAF